MQDHPAVDAHSVDGSMSRQPTTPQMRPNITTIRDVFCLGVLFLLGNGRRKRKTSRTKIPDITKFSKGEPSRVGVASLSVAQE
jgi:hypothetical protein